MGSLNITRCWTYTGGGLGCSSGQSCQVAVRDLPEVPAPIAPPAVEGTNGGYHRAPEVPTAWADEGEAPHYRGNLGFGLIEVRLCQVSRIWIGLYNLHMLSFRARFFLNRPSLECAAVWVFCWCRRRGIVIIVPVGTGIFCRAPKCKGFIGMHSTWLGAPMSRQAYKTKCTWVTILVPSIGSIGSIGERNPMNPCNKRQIYANGGGSFL